MDNHGLRPIDRLVCKTFIARETYTPYDDGGPKNAQSVFTRRNLIVTFSQGDKLKFHHNEDNNTGCIVTHEKTNKKGFVSNEFLIDSSARFPKPWFYGGIDRNLAERYLLADFNIIGSYLIRESANEKDSFVLCFKVYDYTEAAFHVKQVRLNLNGDKVKLMGARAEYNSVEDLLNHYSKTELPFKPRTVLTNVCLLTRAQHPAMRGIRDLFHWMSSEEEIEDRSFAASRMTPSGLVYRGRWRGNVDADVKVVAAVTGSRRALPFELRLIEREFDTMKSLAHPNIVQGSNQQS